MVKLGARLKARVVVKLGARLGARVVKLVVRSLCPTK